MAASGSRKPAAQLKKRTPSFLIEHDDSADLGVVRAVSGPLPSGAKEPVGIAFHTAALRQAGLLADSSSDEDGADAGAGDGSDVPLSSRPSSSGLADSDLQPPPGVSWKRSKSKRKLSDKKKKEADYYALLGLQNERWMATESQIKLAYRRTCLEAHPDKALIGVDDLAEKQRIEDAFKTIQEAYEVLSDPAKRREYDSTDEFDDTLPTGCDPADFFKVFAPAFRRNARWSVNPGVPDVGGPDTPWSEVSAFYDFWFGFKSWREFPHPEEEDVEGAESREHRRWLERMNSKLREKGKKEEAKRLREFVDAAWRIDPRVAGRKEEERLERERKKTEKEDAKRLQKEQEEREKAEAEAKRLADEEEARRQAADAKKQREADKKALKKERQRLRALVEAHAAEGCGGRLLDEDSTERLAQGLDTASLAALCDTAGAAGLSPEARRAALLSKLEDMRRAEEESAAERERQRRESAAALQDIAKRDHSRRMASMSAWTDEELRLLDKACTKYPMGTPRRWEVVAAYVRTRPLDEVLLMVKERQGAASNRLRQQEDWKGAAKKRAEVKSEADLRDSAFTDVVVNLSVEEEAAAAEASSGGTSAAAGPGPGSSGGQQAAGAANGSGGGAAAKPKVVVSASSGEWSEAQELALVQGLKQFGKELEDRWERIAATVEGKTKKQCMARYKELREAFKAKKTEA
ncbi:hypothetical protein Rsub_12217 [Raphidocelis subcapitata]|uniref:Uncharacterized protein n=1 Tax=Raphidocelis subcapitata TaxID=307507 RepID=A0A2V0PQJ0_9CHLO|nr:hypothetical protein Rsub_12217 [Raphidocelis subcapitata]|eukprot:GBF99777.1 hypothetical protein Rsub_12217 [Raphidocelis subcapitata]